MPRHKDKKKTEGVFSQRIDGFNYAKNAKKD
jgi:hypothetical protein